MNLSGVRGDGYGASRNLFPLGWASNEWRNASYSYDYDYNWVRPGSDRAHEQLTEADKNAARDRLKNNSKLGEHAASGASRGLSCKDPCCEFRT